MTGRLWKVASWIVVGVLVVLLVEFPRGWRPLPQVPSVRSPLLTFTWASYGKHLADLWHRISTFSLGTTVDSQSIGGLVSGSIGSSLTLVAIGLFFVIVIGVAKGIYDGWKTFSTTGGTLTSSTIQWLAESIPDFFLIFSLELFGFYLNRLGLPVYFVGSHQFISGTVVPAMILAMLPTMYMSRMVRLAVAEQLGQQYLVTAQAKGLDGKTIVLRHVVPNALHSVLRALVPAIGMLFSNLVIVEYLFYRNGLVAGLFYAIGSRGSEALYTAPSGDPLVTSYYPFDAPLVLTYLTVCVLFIVLGWLVIRGVLSMAGYRGKVNPYTNVRHQSLSRRVLPWQMMLGGIMLAIVLGLGAFANHLRLPNPNTAYFLHSENGKWTIPPFPISSKHWLGTDVEGRDLLSRAIHFTLPTFGYVCATVIGIVLVATILAILSSVLKLRPIRFLIRTWNAYVTVVPGVIGALLIMEIPNIYWIGFHVNGAESYWSTVHSIVFLGVLGFLECGRVAYQLESALDDAQAKEYMEAAEITGNSTWTKFFIYYLGPLRDAVIEQSMVGFSRVLLLVSTLGFFQLGILQGWVMSYGDGFELQAISPDWGALFSQNSRDLIGASWVLFAPALFVTWTIIGMNLLVTGFRIRMNSVPARRVRRTSTWGFRLAAWGRNHPAEPIVVHNLETY